VLIAAVVATVTSCSSQSSHKDSAASRTSHAALVAQSRPAKATLAFAATHFAHGARGTVTVAPAGKAHLSLTIALAVPHYSSYGIALWSDKHHWQGLYTGAQGTNVQQLTISPQTLLRYRDLEVGLQVVHGQVLGHRLIRLDSRSIHYRDLLHVSTSELLNSLLAAEAQ
jgi:hypothetical protein